MSRVPDIEFVEDGLISTHLLRRTHNGAWVRCVTRKPFICQIAGREFPKGERAYRPLSNGKYRMHRIAAVTVEKETHTGEELK